jgi:hypothetical protein
MVVIRDSGPSQSEHFGGARYCHIAPFLQGTDVVLLLERLEYWRRWRWRIKASAMVSQAAARLISASWAKKSVAVVASRKQSCARWRHSLIVRITASSIHARLRHGMQLGGSSELSGVVTFASLAQVTPRNVNRRQSSSFHPHRTISYH